MKTHHLIRLVFLVVLSVLIVPCSLNAQEKKKEKIRVKADYVKVMNKHSFINITTSARINKKNVNVPNLDLIIISETDDDEIELGVTKTNHDGKSKFIITEFDKLLKDSLGVYNISVLFKGNDDFRKASKSLEIKDAIIDAKWIVKDSINYISASLKDKHADSLISDTNLEVNVERLIRSLPIGEEFNYTDKNGTILVPIEEDIPGIDGNLTLEVILRDSDDYGTVKALVEAPVGKPIVFDTNFDERSLWAPRNKTPWFILIFTNLLIVVIWGLFVYLIMNLFKIKKL